MPESLFDLPRDPRLDSFARLAGSKIRRQNWRRIPPIRQAFPTPTAPATARPAPLLGNLQPEQPMPQTTEPEAKPVPKIAKIDQIGMANELVKSYADTLKDDVKATMTRKGAKRAEGDYFDAILTTSETRQIDPDTLVDLFVKRKIDRKQLCSALTVKVTPCEEFLSKEAIDGMTTITQTTSLRITRKNGVVVALVDCLKRLSSAIIPGK